MSNPLVPDPPSEASMGHEQAVRALRDDETNRQRLDKIGERDLVFRPSTTPAPHPQ